jgi:polyribonucleotide nucleotidyltransferase
MQGIKEMPKAVQETINKQFAVIRAKKDIPNTDFTRNKNPWYQQHNWNDKQKEKFKDWFIDRLDEKEFRQEITGRGVRIDKKTKEKIFNQWDLQFGFIDSNE